MGNAGWAGNASRLNRLLQDYPQGVTHATTGLARVTTNVAPVTAKANSGHQWPYARVCFPGIPAREIPGKSRNFSSRFPGIF